MTSRKSAGRLVSAIGAMALAAISNTAAADIANSTLPTGGEQVTLAQFVEDNGASARVDSSGKLRMLSQRVTAAACYVRAGVDTENTLPALMGAATEFEAILDALEFGDPDRGIIGAEVRRRTIVGLEKLRNEFWAPVAEHASLIASGAGDGDTMAVMAELSEPLLEFAKRMVSEISGQYSDPTILLQADAMLIDVSGRQRMLSQRISKNACLLGTGLGSEATLAELTATMSVFETSLFALYHGMPEAGIKTPPTQEISDGLAGVIARWQELQPVLASVVTGGANTESLAIVYTQTTAMTAEMNAVVGLYGEASKLGL